MPRVSAEVMPVPGRRASTHVRDATLAAVVFGDTPLLDLNRELVGRLNPGRPARWRVVRNLPLQPADEREYSPMVEVLDGRELPSEFRKLKKFRSYHHALGLHVACTAVPSRYLVLVDPDCYIVRPNWIEDVLGHMAEQSLLFFGVPYHPQSIPKFRYFPCSVFLVIDTDAVPVETLDWTPEARTPPRPGPVRRVLETPLRLAGWRLRLRHEESEDTGIRVYRRYRDTGVAAECVQPVMLDEHLHSFMKPKQCVLENVLSDRYCVIPKRPGYFTDRSFADVGHVDGTRMFGVEEFMWRDRPFALHLRGAPQSLRQDPEAIRRLLAQFG